MSRYHNPDKPILLIFFIIIALINLQFSTAFATSNQDNGSSLLIKAQNHYHQGEFDQTLKLIRQFMQNDSISNPKRIQAYSLLSKIFIAQQKTDSAKKIVRKIFSLNPAYKPTLEQEKPSYVHLVDAVRREIKPKQAKEAAVHKSKRHTLLWAGAGGATALVLLIGVLLSDDNGGGKSHTLPKPPDFPK